jgi:3-(methylsulfanyl)propanoyl-CoA dehydrogenase
LERATNWLLGGQHNDLDTALAGATPYLRLFALAAGGALLAQEALAARLAGNGADAAARTAIARFFAENIAVQAGGLERTVVEAPDSVNTADAALA